MAMNFVNANSERVGCGTSALFDMGSGEFTLMCWVKFTTTADLTIIGKMMGGGSGNARYILQTISSGKIQFRIRDNAGGGSKTIVSTLALNDGNWHHLAMVRDNGANLLRAYVDGVADGTIDITGTGSLDQANEFGIGFGHSGANTPFQFWDGDIDDGRLYNRLLSAAEILTIGGPSSSGGHDGIVLDLVARYTLNEQEPGATSAGAGVVKDVGPNGLNGTPVNTPTYTESELNFRRVVI